MILKQLKKNVEQSLTENPENENEEQSLTENPEKQSIDGMKVEWQMQLHNHDHFPSWTLIQISTEKPKKPTKRIWVKLPPSSFSHTTSSSSSTTTL